MSEFPFQHLGWFIAAGLLLNLTPGVTYWFDLTLQQVSSGTVTAKAITFTAIEI